MKKFRCIIVDDEPLSRDILRKYTAEVKDLTVLGECRDAFEATHLLNQQKVDLIFLDINMPGLSGISFARSLSKSPDIIFTTAYPEYAVEGFDLNAIDYLVKPYSFERFLKAVNRFLEKQTRFPTRTSSNPNIVVKADKKLYSIEFYSILYVEGQGDYIRIHLENQKLMVHDTLKNFIQSLPNEQFLRIHKSFVVNLDRISYLEGNQVKVGSNSIPVSPPHREELLNRYAPNK